MTVSMHGSTIKGQMLELVADFRKKTASNLQAISVQKHL